MYNTEKIIKKFKTIHGDKYDYSKVDFIKTTIKVCIICPEHGEFWQEPHAHLKGQGCPKCGFKKRIIKKTKTKESFINDAIKIHGNKYDYSLVEYVNNKTKVKIICPIHGVFELTPSALLVEKRGCPKCGNALKGLKLKKGHDKFIEKTKNIYGEKYDYSKTDYKGYDVPIAIICPEYGESQQKPYIHLDDCDCQKCYMLTSHYEIELGDFIASIIGEENIIRNDRTILKSDKLDVYVPTKNIAFEFDGLLWDSEIKKTDKRYHLNKTIECEKQGIQLIHIFEDEWLFKNDICKSRIINLLGNSKKIYARKCEIVELNKDESKKFFINNHIQGNVTAKITYGLKYNGEIISAMSFGNLRKNLGQKSVDGKYELLRFSNKQGITVIGGASKLFKHFIKIYNPIEIISYADRRWSMGNLYEHLNFVFSHESDPNYFYIIDNERKNRFGFRKDILISKYGCSPNDTEHNFCKNKGWYRIYDCGTKVYKWKNHT